MPRIVFAGGPGVGKTTVLLALQARGYPIVGDSARTIIQERRRLGLSPRPPALEFAHVEAVHSGVLEWYRRCRYQVVEVPRGAVAERCAYVLGALESGSA
jgi:predicted ATPase